VVFRSLFMLLFVAVPAGVAAVLGVRGFPLLSWTQRVVISGVLLATAGIAAVASVREMSPAAHAAWLDPHSC
jgi:hypothetical protein